MLITAVAVIFFVTLAVLPLSLDEFFSSKDLAEMGIRPERL